jgi:hypothetical protein
MQQDENSTRQIIVFQQQMPDLQIDKKIPDADKSDYVNGATSPGCTSDTKEEFSMISTAPPMNIARTVTEADLTFKGNTSDGENDVESKDTTVNGEKPHDNMSRRGVVDDLDFFWDGRYHQTSYIKQTDILDDGEPPPPRAGWPIQQLNLRCIVKNLEHPPIVKSHQEIAYFSIELHLGDQIYKTPVCTGNTELGYVKFDQLFSAHIDDDVLEAVSTSIRDGTQGPALTAIIYDCGRRFKNMVSAPARPGRALTRSDPLLREIPAAAAAAAQRFPSTLPSVAPPTCGARAWQR